MKKTKKIVLPFAILLLGAGTAYASTLLKPDSMDFQGYRYDPLAPVGERCILTEKICGDYLGEICTWTDATGTHYLLQNIDGTTCGNQLFERP